jgi:tetratricopeptide (TPR) repeat protein
VKVPHVGEYVEGELGRVLRALSVADRDGDHARFTALCRAHAAELDARRDEWLRAPEELRESFSRNINALRPYLLTVHRLARELDLLDRPAALRQLSGGDGPANPLERFHEAEILAQDGEFDAADALLREQLGGDDRWVGVIYNRLAELAAMRDDLDTAVEYARRAHDLALRTGDRGAETAAWLLDDLLTARELRLGTSDGRQLGACRDTLTRAQQLSDRAWFEESNHVLLRLLDELDALPREASARRFLGKLCGLMGLNHFYAGERDEARAWTRKALEECRRRGDHAGEEVYVANLKEIDRREQPAPSG